MDPAEVATIGFDAMIAGEADVVAGWKNKAMVAMSKVLPSQVVAEQHRKMAEPGTAKGWCPPTSRRKFNEGPDIPRREKREGGERP